MWIHKINPSILNDIYKGSEGKTLFTQGFHNSEMKCRQQFTRWGTAWTKSGFFQEFRENKKYTKVSTRK